MVLENTLSLYQCIGAIITRSKTAVTVFLIIFFVNFQTEKCCFFSRFLLAPLENYSRITRLRLDNSIQNKGMFTLITPTLDNDLSLCSHNYCSISCIIRDDIKILAKFPIPIFIVKIDVFTPSPYTPLKCQDREYSQNVYVVPQA